MMVTSALLIGFVGRLTQEQLAAEVQRNLYDIAAGIAADLNTNGVEMTARDIDAELRLPSANAILLVASDGRRLAGNLATWPTNAPDAQPGQRRPAKLMLRRIGDKQDSNFAVLVVDTGGGYQLLVGHNLVADERLTATLRNSLLAALGLALGLAFLTAAILTRSIVRRVQTIAAVATAVAAGDRSRRVAEAAPSSSNDAFDAMARALNTMLARTEALIDEIRMVTDGLAHDLRSPLTRMKARIDRLARSHPEQGDDILAIGDEADALLAMLDSCLEISRVEAGIGREAFTVFDLAATARSMADMYEPLAEDSGVKLSIDAPAALPLFAHRNLLGRALANLIDNALRYGATGGSIEITAAATPDGVAISVGDRGPGIVASNHAEALRRFGRIDAARAAGGVGLGLPLAAAIARLHGGTLALVANNPGLRVVITLPQPDRDAAE